MYFILCRKGCVLQALLNLRRTRHRLRTRTEAHRRFFLSLMVVCLGFLSSCTVSHARPHGAKRSVFFHEHIVRGNLPGSSYVSCWGFAYIIWRSQQVVFGDRLRSRTPQYGGMSFVQQFFNQGASVRLHGAWTEMVFSANKNLRRSGSIMFSFSARPPKNAYQSEQEYSLGCSANSHFLLVAAQVVLRNNFVLSETTRNNVDGKAPQRQQKGALSSYGFSKSGPFIQACPGHPGICFNSLPAPNPYCYDSLPPHWPHFAPSYTPGCKRGLCS